MTAPEACTVRLLTADGHPVGMGTLVAGRHILTCAHVVNAALGLGMNEQPKPDGIVTVDFPLLPAAPQTQARVALWLPPPRPGAAGDDIAGLDITDAAPPEGAAPVRLAVDLARPGTQVRVFGCPRGRPDGIWAEAIVQGRVLGNRMQLESRSAVRVEQGFSGSPVFDESIGQVTGLIALAPARATERDCYAITSERLRQAWPLVLGEPDRLRDRLTILHLHGPEFPSEIDGPRPDLIVVTGDLAEHALPSEYRRAVRSLTALAAALGVPRRHVAIVPGAHDVNRKACQAYFAEQESREAEPVKPYFPKWNQFAAAFGEFYGDEATTFTPDEPWTLFAMPDLGAVVAGLNSTMAMSHRDEDDGGELGQAQLSWFAERLKNHDQLVIAAVYHDGMTLPGAALTLRAAASGGYELSTVRRPRGDAQPPAAQERDDFFAAVAEATRVRYPAATVTERPHEGYLRVTCPRQDGITEQWPVGVVSGPATEQAIRAFGTGVHAQFAARDPQVPSELVHAGPAAEPGLTRLARQQGVRLRNLIEYQGLLDLRPLAQAQHERLAADRIYAEDLYVPQRFRLANDRAAVPRHGLIGQAVDWLGADSAQLLIVLGDFGRGKTAFLRQLARTLPAELPGLLPILVELRALEKAPTLEALLVLHLAGQGVPDIDVAKLRYMVRSGRLALLFDGFDELELRVGYDNAADYLRVLLASVTGQAKVVLTSRTQHFRSNQQVLDARPSGPAGAHVVVLEDLSDDQITEFLTKQYDGDQDRARGRLALIQDIGNLRDLAHNPRMLTFIATLGDAELRAVTSEERRLSAAALYGEIIDLWLSGEAERHAHQRGLPTLSKRERLDACTALALRIWAAKDPTIALGDLSAEVAATLTRLAERGFSDDQASHSIGSGSLLVRTEDGAFTFVHQSVMEWLVASAAATNPHHAQVFTSLRMSPLMAEFYADLAGHDTARAWADAILTDDQATEVAKQNALMIPGRAQVSAVRSNRRAPSLGGVDLRSQNLDSADLTGADLRGADLRGMRLRGTNLTGADLTGADLRGARLISCALDGAVLTGSRWERAALLTPVVADAAELRAAAVPGRDRAEVMIAPQPKPYRVAYSPDGSLLAVASYDFVEILDTDGYQTIRVLRPDADQVRSIAFSPDGGLLAVATRASGALVLDVATGDVVNRMRDSHGGANAVAFSPPGTEVATAAQDGTAVTWDLASGTEFAFIHGGKPLLSVAYSPDGIRRATGSADGSFGIWDAPSRVTLTKPGSEVSALAFSPDGTLLATGDYFGIASLHDAVSGAERATFPTIGGGVADLAFSPDGSLLAGACVSAGACVWEVATQQIMYRAPDVVAYGVAFSPDGTEMAIAAGTQLSVFDLSSRRTTAVQRSEQRWAQVAFTQDGDTVTAALEDTPSHDWNLAFGMPRVGVPTPVRTVVSRGRSRRAIAIGGTVLIYNAGEPTPMATLGLEDAGAVNDLAFSPDGRLLVTASQDGMFRLWDRSTELATTARGAPGPATAVTFTPGGTRVFTGSADGGIREWDVSQFTGIRRVVGRLTIPPRPEDRQKVHAGAVYALAFSDDGSLLASGSADGTAIIWTGNVRQVATLRGHLGPVRAVAFSPDKSRLATACEDRAIRIWDITAVTVPRLVLTLLDLPDGGYAAVLPDGRYKLRGDPAGQLWWAVKLCRFAPGELDDYVPGLTRIPDDAPLGSN